MRKRMERGKVELDRTRKKELDQLLQRYDNVKKGLKGQQAILKAKTSTMITKHANNSKTEKSGSQAISTAVTSGAFGPVLRPTRSPNPSSQPNGNEPSSFHEESDPLRFAPS